MKCRRPKCWNKGQPGKRGLCSKHHRLELRESGRVMGSVPAGPIVDHLSRLLEAGLSARCIGKCAGVSAMSVCRISGGGARRVHADTAARLLSVRPADVLRSAAGASIPAVGTVRRLRALHAIGYTGVELADRMGVTPRTLYDYLSGSALFLRADKARRAAELFAALEVTPPSRTREASRAVNRARKLGWPLPLQWNIEDIDDPDAQSIKTCLDADWFPEYEKLRARGYSRKRIAALMGITPGSLTTRLRRLEAA